MKFLVVFFLSKHAVWTNEKEIIGNQPKRARKSEEESQSRLRNCNIEVRETAWVDVAKQPRKITIMELLKPQKRK